MKNINTFILLLLSIVCIHFATCLADTKIVSARIESCPGCSLNRLPEVKKFIYEDAPHYDNVIFKKIQGAIPELLFLDSDDAEIERVQLSSLSRQECNDLLSDKGFVKKGADKEEF